MADENWDGPWPGDRVTIREDNGCVSSGTAKETWQDDAGNWMAEITPDND